MPNKIFKGGKSRNSEEHGFGFTNIQRIVRKYHGEWRTEIKNEEFYVSILYFRGYRIRFLFFTWRRVIFSICCYRKTGSAILES